MENIKWVVSRQGMQRYMRNEHPGQLWLVGINEATVFNSEEEANEAIGLIPEYDKENLGAVKLADALQKCLDLALDSHFKLETQFDMPVDRFNYILDESRKSINALKVRLAEEVPPKCLGCEKHPSDLYEYKSFAQEEGMSPEEFVVKQEGTFEKYAPNSFLCTKCFIAYEAGRLDGGLKI